MPKNPIRQKKFQLVEIVNRKIVENNAFFFVLRNIVHEWFDDFVDAEHESFEFLRKASVSCSLREKEAGPPEPGMIWRKLEIPEHITNWDEKLQQYAEGVVSNKDISFSIDVQLPPFFAWAHPDIPEPPLIPFVSEKWDIQSITEKEALLVCAAVYDWQLRFHARAEGFVIVDEEDEYIGSFYPYEEVMGDYAAPYNLLLGYVDEAKAEEITQLENVITNALESDSIDQFIKEYEEARLLSKTRQASSGPEDVPTKAKKKAKRGRQPIDADEGKRRFEIVRKYQDSNRSRKKFCEDEGIHISELHRYEEWCRMQPNNKANFSN